MTRVLESCVDESLAELCDELAGRLHAGEPLDADELPESLRELLPALHALVEVANPGRKAGGGSVSGSAQSAQSPPALRPGFASERHALGKLGDFRLLREIGRGGMGVVYEAEQISLGRRVALKVLPFAAALNPRQLQRFRSEAQAAASLHHPNVVPVYAVGCEQGVHYYAMQLIDGQTLADAVAQTRRAAGFDGAATSPDSTVLADVERPTAAKTSCPVGTIRTTVHSHGDRAYFRRVAELTAQAAEALDYAHQLGVVHRDVKPANLMVDGRGALWVTDFGLVRYAHDAGLTVSGELLGTLRYMSPEQATAKRGVVDHRTDVYALGATLYELLTLQPVFGTESRGELLTKIVRDEPTPPRRLNRAVPAALETVVLKALAKSPQNRYATAQEFADDLRRYLADQPVLARRPSVAERVRRWAWRHRSVVVGVAAAAVFAAICLGASGASVCHQRDHADRKGAQARRAVDEMYTEVAEKWLAQQPHLQPLQREYLQRALEFYEGFAKEDGCKLCVKLASAKALLRVADIRAKLGEPSDAAYAAAIDRFRDLSSVPEARIEWAVALNHRGNLRRGRGRPCDALRDYLEAEAQFGQLADERPDDAACRAGLAGSRVNVGLARHELHAFAEAEAAYRKALPLFEQLSCADPTAPNHRHDLAGCVNNLGLVLLDTDRKGPAEEAFSRAAALWKVLILEKSDFPPYRRAAATNLANLAFVFASTSRHAEADGAYRDAQAIRERLASEYPMVVAYRQELAATLHGRGLARSAAGHTKEAERFLREAFAQRTQLAAAFPGVLTHQRDLAASHHAFGDLLAATGKRAAADQAYRAALTLREKLAGECPTPVYATELMATRTAIERVRAAGGE